MFKHRNPRRCRLSPDRLNPARSYTTCGSPLAPPAAETVGTLAYCGRGFREPRSWLGLGAGSPGLLALGWRHRQGENGGNAGLTPVFSETH